MSIYLWLKSKEMDYSILTVYSLCISFVISNFYTALHGFVMTEKIFNDGFRITIYIITAVILPFLYVYLVEDKLLAKILKRFSHKIVNDSIFDTIIDDDKATSILVQLKNCNVYYIGKLRLREENKNDSWFVLIDYLTIDKTTNNVLQNDGLNSLMPFKLQDVERMEIYYEDDSKVWKNLKTI